MIEKRMREVFYAPTRGRHYFTKKAAITAEAKSIILKKYPTEREHVDSFGRIEYPGWHWASLPRAGVLLRRVCRLVEAGAA